VRLGNRTFGGHWRGKSVSCSGTGEKQLGLSLMKRSGILVLGKLVVVVVVVVMVLELK